MRNIFRLLAVFIGGVALAQGRLQVSKHRRLNNPHGYIVGAMMLLSGLLGGVMMGIGIVMSIVYGLVNLTNGDRVQRF